MDRARARGHGGDRAEHGVIGLGARLSACVAALLAAALPAAAQCPLSAEECTPESPRWVGEFSSLSANAVLGGITAGVRRMIDGGSFRDGFLDGLPGGAAVYAGKRLASARFDGAGLLGRQLGAAGTSMVANAGEGRPLLDRLALPAGPVLVEFERGGGLPSLRLDVIAAGWTIYGIAEPELTFDAGRSLSAGAPVFLTDGKLISFGDPDAHAAGVTWAGVIFLADVPAYGARVFERSLRHERVHVVQQDFFAGAWTAPLADGLLARTPIPAAVASHIRVNLSTELMRGLGTLIPEHRDRPWEIEAIFFAR